LGIGCGGVAGTNSPSGGWSAAGPARTVEVASGGTNSSARRAAQADLIQADLIQADLIQADLIQADLMKIFSPCPRHRA
jgi:hypothetical protein